jgi:predicted lactoylglutathione lyase
MIGYVTLGTNDLQRAAAFYDAILAHFGAKRVWSNDRGIGWGAKGPMLAVMKPYDGQAATHGNGTMIALSVDSKEKVDAIYKQALALGGTDEGPAGARSPTFYGAYFRDLDGNKLAVYSMG